jgi:hypothetical protein
LAAFTAARAWLRQFSKLKRVNQRGTSYGYITNGVFIAAAIAEGYRVRRTRGGSPNAWFNISTKAWARETMTCRSALKRRSAETVRCLGATGDHHPQTGPTAPPAAPKLRFR